MLAAGMSSLATVGPRCHAWDEGFSPGGGTKSSTGSTRTRAGDLITYRHACDARCKISRLGVNLGV